MKRVLLYLLIFVCSTVASFYFTGQRAIKTASSPALEDFTIEFSDKKQVIGLVDLEQAFKAHPRYRELEELQVELTRQQQDWQAWLEEQNKQATLKHQSKLEQTLSGQLEKIQEQYRMRLEDRQKILQEQLTREEKARMEEIEKKLQSREKEIMAKLQETIQKQESAMKQELADYETSLQDKNKARVVNLKLKLANLPLSEEERKRVEEELAGIDGEQKQLVALKEASLSAQLKEFAASKQEENLKNLEAYQQTLVQNAGSELDTLRQKLEADFGSEVRAQEAKLEAQAKTQQEKIGKLRDEEAEAAFRKQIEDEAGRREKALANLQKQAQILEQEILADLQQLARDLGKEKRVGRLDVINPGQKREWSLWQLDLTSDLLEILKREK